LAVRHEALFIKQPRVGPAISVAKRISDILLALTLLVLLAPFMALIAIAIRLDSGGPSLFRQRRTGLNGRPFTILKFRTMTVMEDHDDIRQAERGDTRITSFGAFLRRFSLDELPQLVNVILGDMAIIGPRPHALAHDQHYSLLIDTYSLRFRTRPGMTGLAQVLGYRGEIHALSDMVRRIEADNAYIEGWTFWRDLWIGFRTLPMLVIDDKAY